MRTVIFLSAYAISLILGLSSSEKASAADEYLCELQLTSHHHRSAQEALQTHFFNRPFSLFFAHETREKSYRKLNLPEDITTEELDNLLLVARVREENSAEDPLLVNFYEWSEARPGMMSAVTFPFADPFLWRSVKSVRGGIDLHPAEVLATLPQQKVGLSYDHKTSIGYFSDPDVDGVRRYLSVRGENDLYVDVTLGLDIPCELSGEYTWEEANELDRVVTSGVEYCRVPVLSFSRVERLRF